MPAMIRRHRIGALLSLVVLVIFGSVSVWIDPVEVRRTPVDPTATPGFQSDEATYYLMGQSLVHDGDLEYRAEDLQRTLAEFPLGPSGVFLKRGAGDHEAGLDRERLFFGKSFAYPLFASPFVAVFGTRGFHVFNAVLLAGGIWLAFVFISARSAPGVSAVLAGGFLIPTVVPVYWAWIQPELFNCVLGLAAYFCWLYKFVSPDGGSRGWTWLRGPASDVVAAIIIGVLTFSKPTNALLGAPIGAWLLWHREWRTAGAVAAAFVLTSGLWFGANLAIMGDWNYQGGGDRSTCYGPYPFQAADQGLEVCASRGTDEALTTVWFDREMFWSNLRANLGYFVVGRFGGVLAYFFPLVFATIALVLSGHRQRSWQWLVFASVVAQGLIFVVTQPYTYFGGGGSVGNRYLMAGYGVGVFMLPPMRSLMAALAPWIVGGAFMAPLVLSPFDTSMRPGDRAYSGPLRLLPPELTNFNDLPVMTEGELMRRTFGHPDYRYQILYLDKNAWLQEADGMSFWTRGRSRAEMLVRTNGQARRLDLHLAAGPHLPVTVLVDLNGDSQRLTLAPEQRGTVQLALPPGFPYRKFGNISYIWKLAIEADSGWVPAETDGSPDNRLLGVRVTPIVIR